MAIFTGTDANDSYLSTSAGDNARGLRGDDTLIGGAGKDTLNGNADNDLLLADSAAQTAGGNDSLFGGQGNDTLVGARFGFSSDSLGGNRGDDLLIASTNGSNTLFGGQGDDTLYGSVSGSNLLNGDLGSDVLIAGKGGDRMLGGAEGNDTLIGGAGSDQMFGGDGSGSGSGNDEFQFFTGIDATLPIGQEQATRQRGGFGGNDVINDFSTGDKISISQLDRGATVSVETVGGNAVISITGTASSGQSTNGQKITVVGKTRDQLLDPGSQLFAINGNFVTKNNTANTDGKSTFTVGDNQPGGDVKGLTLKGSVVADAFDPDPGVATTADGILLQTTVNDDIAKGDAGNDWLNGGAGNDNLDGGPSSSGFSLSGFSYTTTTATASTDTAVTTPVTSAATFSSFSSIPFIPAATGISIVTAASTDTAVTTAVTATAATTTTFAGAYNPSVPGDTLIGNTGIDTLTGGTGSDEFRFVNFTDNEVDVITDYRRSENDIISIDASAFNAATGSSLVAGAIPSGPSATLTSSFFMFDFGGGAAPVNATNGTIGVASIYYDTAGGGLYFDPDGAGSASYKQFAVLAPAPQVGFGFPPFPFGEQPTAGSFKIIA